MSKIPVYIFQLYHYLYRIKVPLIPIILMYLNRMLFGCYLPPSVKIGRNFRLAYGGAGVVIHKNTVIGDNVIIGNCVTIGGRNKIKNVPIIKDGAYIATGAKILGDVSIGKDSIVGANSVVLEDVPDFSIAVGLPARITKKNIDKRDYI